MPIEQYTYWSITINNPDENDKLIITNPNEKYIRSLVWTPEVGEEGTEHIQAWVRLQRNQGLAFIKRLYPRAHVKPCDKDIYNMNCHQYAQKNDDTTAGNHHITLHDPLPANDTLLYKVLDKAFDDLMERKPLLNDHYQHDNIQGVLSRFQLKDLLVDVVEREMIMERSGLEKIFVSPAYEKMKVKYWREILLRIKHKQQDVQEVQLAEVDEESSGSEEEQGEDYEDGGSSTDEGSTESSGSEVDESFD